VSKSARVVFDDLERLSMLEIKSKKLICNKMEIHAQDFLASARRLTLDVSEAIILMGGF